MATVFTRIINGEFPGRFVWSDERCVAFLSINPIRPGHTLVVPRAEIDQWIDLEPELNAHLIGVAQHIAQAQRHTFGRQRIGLIIAGFEVPHTHLHLIPTDDMGGLDFGQAAAQPDPAALDAAADVLRSELIRRGYEAAST